MTNRTQMQLLPAVLKHVLGTLQPFVTFGSVVSLEF